MNLKLFYLASRNAVQILFSIILRTILHILIPNFFKLSNIKYNPMNSLCVLENVQNKICDHNL